MTMRAFWYDLKRMFWRGAVRDHNERVQAAINMDKNARKLAEKLIKKYGRGILGPLPFSELTLEFDEEGNYAELIQIFLFLLAEIRQQNDLLHEKFPAMPSDYLDVSLAKDTKEYRKLVEAKDILHDALMRMIKLEDGYCILVCTFVHLYECNDWAWQFLAYSIFGLKILGKSYLSYFELVASLWVLMKTTDGKAEVPERCHKILVVILGQLAISFNPKDRLLLTKIVAALVDPEIRRASIYGGLLAHVVAKARTDEDIEAVIEPLIKNERYIVLGYLLAYLLVRERENIPPKVFCSLTYRSTKCCMLMWRALTAFSNLGGDYTQLVYGLAPIINMDNELLNHADDEYMEQEFATIKAEEETCEQIESDEDFHEYYNVKMEKTVTAALAHLWLKIIDDVGWKDDEQTLQTMLEKIIADIHQPEGLGPNGCFAMFYFTFKWLRVENFSSYTFDVVELLMKIEGGYALLARLLTLKDVVDYPEKTLNSVFECLGALGNGYFTLADELAKIAEHSDNIKLKKRIKAVFAHMLSWIDERHNRLTAFIKQKGGLED